MAKYEITHACGCTRRYNLVGSGESRERKIAWYESVPCLICKEKAEREVAEKVSAEHGLPALVGSAKQVEWAERIRGAFFAAFPESRVARFLALDLDALKPFISDEQLLEKAYGTLRKAVEAVTAETSASWWIDHRDGGGYSKIASKIEKGGDTTVAWCADRVITRLDEKNPVTKKRRAEMTTANTTAITVDDFRAAIERAISTYSEARQHFLRDYYFDLNSITGDVMQHLMARVLKVSALDEITAHRIDGMEIPCDGEHAGSGTKTTSFGDGEVIDGIFLCTECALKAKERQAEIDDHDHGRATATDDDDDDDVDDDDLPLLKDLVRITYHPHGGRFNEAIGFVASAALRPVEGGFDYRRRPCADGTPAMKDGWLAVTAGSGYYAVKKEAVWTKVWEDARLSGGYATDCPTGGLVSAGEPEAKTIIEDQGTDAETIYLRKECW